MSARPPSRLVVGTVRGRRGPDLVVRTREGAEWIGRVTSPDGTPVPMGVDLIGRPDADGTLVLVPDVAVDVLRRGARIVPVGRPDVTARLLAASLDGAGPGVLHVGRGGVIDRTPRGTDPDIDFALATIGPLTERLGVALNVVDPTDLAHAPWDDGRLRDEILPADTEHDPSGLAALRSSLSRGLPPTLRTSVHGRGVRSVDFLVPFSPFCVGQDVARDLVGATRDEVATVALSTRDARRFLTLRLCCLALADRYLPRAGRHRQEAFADVGATTLMKHAGTGGAATLGIARLREAALARWRVRGWGDAPPATHTALVTAHRTAAMNPRPAGPDKATDVDRILAGAGRAALVAPADDASVAALADRSIEGDVVADFDAVPSEVTDRYEVSLERLLDTFGDVALSRYAEYAAPTVPERLARVIDPILSSKGLDEPVDWGVPPIEDDFVPTPAIG